MKRKKIDIDQILKRHLPKPSKEEIEKSGAKVLERLREHLRDSADELSTVGSEDSPAAKAVRRLRETDGLVLRAIQILEGKADLLKIAGIVNDLGEPADLDDITMSLKRLDKKGAISLRMLFPQDAPVQDAVHEKEHLKAGNLAKEKL
jgi:hypothetical protein